MREQAGVSGWGLPRLLGLLILAPAICSAGLGQTVNDGRVNSLTQNEVPRPELTRAAIDRALPLLLKASTKSIPSIGIAFRATTRPCRLWHSRLPASAVSLSMPRRSEPSLNIPRLT